MPVRPPKSATVSLTQISRTYFTVVQHHELVAADDKMFNCTNLQAARLIGQSQRTNDSNLQDRGIDQQGQIKIRLSRQEIPMLPQPESPAYSCPHRPHRSASAFGRPSRVFAPLFSVHRGRQKSLPAREVLMRERVSVYALPESYYEGRG